MNAFDEFKNQNGTYNGVALLAKLSGMSDAEVAAIWEKAKLRVAERKAAIEKRLGEKP